MNWPHKWLPSPVPRLDDHVSIWSVTARDARTFFRIAALLWLVAFILIVYQKLVGQGPPPADRNWRIGGEFLLVVLADLGTVGLGIAIVSMLLIRAVNKTGEVLMSFYQFVVNRFVIPVIEEHEARGRAEGLEQGIERGIERGRAESQAEWRAWNERRLAAELHGSAP